MEMKIVKGKKAFIRVELVEESSLEKNEKIKQEIFDWFSENGSWIPWAKEIKQIVIEEDQH